MRQRSRSSMSSHSQVDEADRLLSSEHANRTAPPVFRQPAGATSENEQCWQAQYVFRSRILGLHVFISVLCAMIIILPGVHAGCPAPDVCLVIIVLAGLPTLEWLVNASCNRFGLSSATTKLALAPLLTIYYSAIVVYDMATHIMMQAALQDYEEEYEESTPAAAIVASCSSPLLRTLPNQRIVLEQLVDLTFNFFVISSILESRLSRGLLIAAHFTLWIVDNLTHDVYYPRQHSQRWTYQVIWHWTTFTINEATQMATVLIIAIALEEAQRAHAKRLVEQVELRLRTEQLEEEKDRLLWEAKLHEHSKKQLVKLEYCQGDRTRNAEEVDSFDERSEQSATSHACSYHTAKVTPGAKWIAFPLVDGVS